MANRFLRRQKYPWREGNGFQLLVNGNNIFPAMLAAIEAAQSQILLEMYLVQSGTLLDRFITSLVEASKRGVNVYLLFDDYGTRGFEQLDRRRLERAGIYTVYYNPVRYGDFFSSLLRDHRKLLVIDEQTAFVGGIGIADVFDVESHPGKFWHDVAVQARGPVVGDWVNVFHRNWHTWTRLQITGAEKRIESGATDRGASPGQVGRVAAGRFFGRSEIQRSFIKRIHNAERRVWMMTAYFVPSYRLLRALRKAARRGVDVRLVLPGPITDHPAVRYAGRRYFYTLLDAGVRIFEYQPRFLHAKVLLCDGWVSLGSSNIDRWNLRWNLEGNQEIEDTEFAALTTALFEADIQFSEECKLQQWQSRSGYHRCLEWFWGKIDLLLENLSERIGRRKGKR